MSDEFPSIWLEFVNTTKKMCYLLGFTDNGQVKFVTRMKQKRLV